MTKTKLTLVRLGNASRLTQSEAGGPFAEIGVMRSKTPL